MLGRAVPPLVLLCVSAGCFAYALWALGKRDDVIAALSVVCGALAALALRRSVLLLEGP